MKSVLEVILAIVMILAFIAFLLFQGYNVGYKAATGQFKTWALNGQIEHFIEETKKAEELKEFKKWRDKE